MKALLDTNIILDILLKRQPFVASAQKVLQTTQHHQIQLFMTATTVTDVFYISRKEKGKEKTLEFIEDFLQFVEVASVDKAVILQALRSKVTDFEDAVQECAAKQAGISTIITRNDADFRNTTLDIYSPESFLNTFIPSA